MVKDLFERIREYLSVRGGEDDYQGEDDFEEGIDDTEEVDTEDDVEEESKLKTTHKITKVDNDNIVPIKKEVEVTMYRPTSVEESRLVVDSLKKGKTVVLNLEDVRTAIAQRIVDFVCGAAYEMQGNLQSISESIFIVTPANVVLSGDFTDLLGIEHNSSDASGFGG